MKINEFQFPWHDSNKLKGKMHYETDECVTFGGKEVKFQGHCRVIYAGNNTLMTELYSTRLLALSSGVSSLQKTNKPKVKNPLHSPV